MYLNRFQMHLECHWDNPGGVFIGASISIISYRVQFHIIYKIIENTLLFANSCHVTTLGPVIVMLQKHEFLLIGKFHLFPNVFATSKDFSSYSRVTSLDVMYNNYTLSLYYMQDKNSFEDESSPIVVVGSLILV